MSGFEVVIERIRKAAQAATSAGEQASQVDLAEALSELDDALPGSKSAKKVPEVREKLYDDTSQWVAEVHRYAQNLTSSADLYAASEEQARQNLDVPPVEWRRER